MRYFFALLLLVVALAIPNTTHAAVALGNTSTKGSTGVVTSLSWSHTATGDSLLVVGLNTRLACSATDVTGVTITYNGVAPTGYIVGSADTSVFGGDCGHARAVYWTSPSTGSNTISISWTGSARASAVAYSFTGADSVGTAVEQTKSTANYDVAATITANDMVLGLGYFSDNVTLINSTESNYLEVQDSDVYEQTTGATDVGTGSVTISGTCRAFGHSVFAIPIVASAGGGAPAPIPEEPIWYE